MRTMPDDIRYPVFAAVFRDLSDRWIGADSTRNAARLAEELDLDPAMISHYRSGRFRPDGQGGKIGMMCAVFGLRGQAAAELYQAAGVDVSAVIAEPIAEAG